ncbi:hypothetical protein EDB84DRAFT_1437763 [Lactarius hengduanensis]|nr:hypothetical protein EDB84DRAFT_1437763 [Lactarius hengduanensis]
MGSVSYSPLAGIWERSSESGTNQLAVLNILQTTSSFLRAANAMCIYLESWPPCQCPIGTVPADWVRIELEGGISHLWCGKAVGSKRDLMPRCHTFNLKPVPPGTCSGVFSSPRSGVCTMVNFHKLRASSKMLSSASKTLKRARGACKGKSRRGIIGTSTGLDSAEATLTSPGPRDRKGSVKKGGMAKGATTGAPVSQG